MRDQLELRALDPVGRCLIRRLTVPRVYYDAEWPGLPEGRVDLLAIDRDGVGDAHLVEIRHTLSVALACTRRLLAARAPYRWIAFFRGTEDRVSEDVLLSEESLYVPGQAGRIGVIEVVTMAGNELGANVKRSAERFATPAYDIATAYSNTHQAQIQFGG